MTSNTQLSAASGYNTNNMTFSKPQMGEIPGPPKIVYHRINIGNKNDDGTVGELVFNTSNVFSFGVSPNTNPDSGKVNGYTLPLCLWNKDGASEEEKDFTDTFNNCEDKCADHILKVRDDIEQYDLDKNDLKIKPNGLLYFSNSELIDISSTDIRDRIALNQNLDGLLPSSVINFLQ